MQNTYDATFKILVDHSPEDWAEFVFGSTIGLASPVDTSLHATKEVVDRLLRVESLGCVHHSYRVSRWAFGKRDSKQAFSLQHRSNEAILAHHNVMRVDIEARGR